jgi:hypothetical protein
MLQYFNYDLSFVRLLTSPWDLTFHHNYPWFLTDRPGSVGPFLLALSPVLLFVRKWRKSAVLFSIFTLLFYLYWLVGEKIQHIRYMVTAYPINGLVVAWGVTEVFNLDKFSTRNKTHILFVILLLSLGFSHFYRTTASPGFSATCLEFTTQSREEYLNDQLSEYTLISEVINTQIKKGKEMLAEGKVEPNQLVLTEDTKIYGLSCENRRFYVDCILVGGLFGYANYIEFMEHAGSSDELYEYLDSLGCDFLLVNKTVAERMAYRVDINLPEDEHFSERFQEIASMGDVILYYLFGPGETGHLTGFSTGEELQPEQTGEIPNFERIVPEAPETPEPPTPVEEQPGY